LRMYEESKPIMVVLVCVMITFLLASSGTAHGEETGQPDLAKLINDFLSDNFSVSLKAMDGLIHLGDEAIPSLTTVFRANGNPWNRVKVINVLEKIGSPKAIELLVSGIALGIGERENPARENSIGAIRKLTGPSKDFAMEYLVPYLKHGKIWAREAAMDLLLELGMSNEEVAGHLVEHFRNGSKTVQGIALHGLRRLGKEANGVLEELLTEIDFADDNELEKSINILRTIVQIGDTEDKRVKALLFELLLSSDFEMRQEAIWGMRWLGLSGEEMVEQVMPLIVSGVTADQELGIAILTQLAITQPAAVENLMALAQDEQHPEQVHDLALKGLQSLVPQLEYEIGRGLVAVMTDAGVLVSWRLLGTEPYDLGFNIYRDGVKINAEPIVKTTNYLDQSGTLDSSYYICSVWNNQELDASAVVSVWEKHYLSIPMVKPAGGVTPAGDRYGYHVQEASVGNLTGDSELELVVKWDPSNAKDNSEHGYTGNVYIDAYTLDGELLWRIDMGHNIRAGNHYTQFMVYDLDGDGRAEIVMRTADGTVDGQGNVIGDPNADYRDIRGRILSGPEYMTVFDGETGVVLDTIDYKPPRGSVNDWGDTTGNRADRFLAAIAYLDGQRPSVIMARGYYTRTALVAYDFVDGRLKERWVFDTASDLSLRTWQGQGNHQLSVADVDSDGKDEIIYGAMTIDDDGTGLYNTGLGHGDALHVGVFDLNRPGFQVFGVHENVPNDAGINLRDARTGDIIWSYPTDYDVGRGMAANVDPNYPGAETWAWRSPLMDAYGNAITSTYPPNCFAIWWDGDLQREIMEYTTLFKWDWEKKRVETILAPSGLGQNHRPIIQADLFGDWREEVIFRSADSLELRLYITTDLTDYRYYTLMHDRMYRVAIAWQNVAYNQPPHPSFYIGEEVDPPTFNVGLIKTFLDQVGERQGTVPCLLGTEL